MAPEAEVDRESVTRYQEYLTRELPNSVRSALDDEFRTTDHVPKARVVEIIEEMLAKLYDEFSGVSVPIPMLQPQQPQSTQERSDLQHTARGEPSTMEASSSSGPSTAQHTTLDFTPADWDAIMASLFNLGQDDIAGAGTQSAQFDANAFEIPTSNIPRFGPSAMPWSITEAFH